MAAFSDELSSGSDQDMPNSGNGQVEPADARLFHSITLRNLLSFPPENESLELKALNVLIGPNGSGKSNLLAAIDLLRATTSDLRTVLAKGGGVGEWVWKGQPNGEATIRAVIADQTIAHFFAFRSAGQSFRLASEQIDNPRALALGSKPTFYYAMHDDVRFVVRTGEEQPVRLRRELDPNRTVLAQLSEPEIYPQITLLKESYDRIRLYREWSIGRSSVFREPQKADLRSDRLDEDFSNLGLFLNQLRGIPRAKRAIVSQLQDLYENLTDFDLSIKGGTVQVFFTEDDFTIPASRLSDGSLRYLCLLAILCDPSPPPLIGIEEPELGLHPDLLPKLADLLVDASSRCQLIVTTHSDILVDALSEQPESVIVCEKNDGRSSMRRLSAKELAPWLEKYRLGQLWTSGQLGGTRW